jgi:hypothetical protein
MKERKNEWNSGRRTKSERKKEGKKHIKKGQKERRK